MSNIKTVEQSISCSSMVFIQTPFLNFSKTQSLSIHSSFFKIHNGFKAFILFIPLRFHKIFTPFNLIPSRVCEQFRKKISLNRKGLNIDKSDTILKEIWTHYEISTSGVFFSLMFEWMNQWNSERQPSK